MSYLDQRKLPKDTRSCVGGFRYEGHKKQLRPRYAQSEIGEPFIPKFSAIASEVRIFSFVGFKMKTTITKHYCRCSHLGMFPITLKLMSQSEKFCKKLKRKPALLHFCLILVTASGHSPVWECGTKVLNDFLYLLHLHKELL